MPRATTNKSLRATEPKKALRRRSALEGETAQTPSAAGASGAVTRAPRRPGRKAALLSTAHNTRSQKWRAPTAGGRKKRRGVLAIGSHTGRNRART